MSQRDYRGDPPMVELIIHSDMQTHLSDTQVVDLQGEGNTSFLALSLSLTHAHTQTAAATS